MSRVARSAASALVAAALLIGVPWLLAGTIGNPADRWPDLLAGDVNNQVVLAVLSAVVWLAWAQFAVAFGVELVSAVRRTPMPARIPGVLAAQQGLARALVNGALLLLPVTVSAVAPAGQALAMTATLPAPAAAAARTADPAVQRPVAPQTAAAPQTAHAPRAATQDVTLTDGGPRTWWDLATEHLGDGAAWRQLWSLNDGRVQADGTVLTSQRTMLRPGWTIAVPAAATTGSDVQVRPGDTLSQIAVDHGIADWTALWPANDGRPEPGGHRLTDPDYIEPGWTVTIPHDSIPTAGDPTAGDPAVGNPAEPADRADAAADTAAGSADTADGSADIVVTVEAGDTLSEIAAAHGADIDAVTAANRGTAQPDGGALSDPDGIRPGWRLVIPAPTTAATDNTGTPPGSTGTPTDNGGPEPADNGGGGPAEDTGTAEAAPDPAPEPAPAPAAAAPTMTAPATPSPLPAEPMTNAPDPTEIAPDAAPPPSSSSAAAAVFVGGGGVLAAVLLAALLRYRRRQFRHRLPGHRVAATPAELVGMERALLTAGTARAADAAWLDEALRGLAHQVTDDPQGRLPDVVAACLTEVAITLVLQQPRTDPPGGWSASPDGRRWTLRRDQATGYDPAQRGYVIAPFPALATVGSSTGGEHWLLDLERIGSLTVAGDPDRATALARFLAAELAHNTWSDSVQVTLVGFGAEMARLHPQRLTYAADAAAALEMLQAQRRSVTGLIDDAGVDVLDGRLRGVAGDGWAPHVLLIAPAAGQRAAVGELIAAVAAGPVRSTVALVITDPDTDTDADTGAAEANSGPEPGAGPDSGGWRVWVGGDGVLTVPALGVSLIGQQLPAREAAQLAQLLAFTADTDPQGAADGLPPAGGDQAAAAAAGRWGRPGSVLPLPDHVYLEQAATTAEDLDALAPPVPAELRAEAETADTDLDRDVAVWRDPADPRPKVTLLGVPAVRAAGQRFSAFNIEAVAYLATHDGGVGIERYAADLWPEDPTVVEQTRVKSKVRTSISQVRKLLGINPRTGTDYLPRNAGAPGAAYRLDGDVLVDADLFRRLRVRGLARGADGITDLWAALDLVQGPPFHDRRPGGYGWLAAVPLDHEYTGLIVDLAHVLATHHLAAGDPERAAAAAQTALRAGSSEDTPLLDLVAACQAQGQDARAEAYVKQILVNHDVEDEEDLPPRTYQILRRRRWLPPAA